MTNPTQTTHSVQDWGLLFCLSFIWGGAFMAMATALSDYQPLTVSAARVAIGAAGLLAIVLVTGARGIPWRNPKLLGIVLLMGVLNFSLPFSLLAWGLQHVPSAFAGIAMGSSPLFVLVLAYLFVPDEEIGPRRIAGVVLGFIGLLVLVLGGSDTQTDSDNLVARLACVAAALCYSIGAILIRRTPQLPPLMMTTVMLIGGALGLIPLALAVEGVPQIRPSMATWALIYAGLLPTGLAFSMRVILIQSAGPVFMSLVAYIIPIWAVLLGVTLLNESLSPAIYLGTAIVLTGVGLTQLRFWWPRKRTARSPRQTP